jgi:chromate reductase, NAD(P)H dehydrogenase (quinone)
MKVAKIYSGLLNKRNAENEIMDLTLLPDNFIVGELHGKRSERFSEMINRYIASNSVFIFVVPEYNGSFPGVLKLFIDAIHPKEWSGKYACLVGVSVGRAGNLRGMEHLTGILNYLKMHVYHNRLPISSVDKLLDDSGNFTSEEQIKVCAAQLEGFLDWAMGAERN